jgi:KGK domain
MTDRSAQIIPDPNAVARCLDPKILELLGSHSTFTIDELAQKIGSSSERSIDYSLEDLLSREKLNIIFNTVAPGNCDFSKITKDINEAIKPLILSLSTDQLNLMHEKIRIDRRYGSSDFIKTIFLETTVGSVKSVTLVKSVANILTDGTSVSLLQPDGKGWQKGKLKLCFEFIPEEDPIATQEKPLETQSSPLDEIRQLSNELTSMVSLAEPLDKRIEQN